MDITYILGALGLIYIIFMPMVTGWAFLLCGINKIAAFNPELDKTDKKRGAALDIILGLALLIFHNLFFWLALWPLLALQFNLPSFSLY